MNIRCTLNGKEKNIIADPSKTLGSVLRDDFHLLSIKPPALYGHSESSAVLLNDTVVPAWFVPVFLAEKGEIVTLEHFYTYPAYELIITGFEQAGIRFCDYCNAGKIFFTYAALRIQRELTDTEIRRMFSGIFCRCTCMEDIVDAVKRMKAQNTRI